MERLHKIEELGKQGKRYDSVFVDKADFMFLDVNGDRNQHLNPVKKNMSKYNLVSEDISPYPREYVERKLDEGAADVKINEIKK